MNFFDKDKELILKITNAILILWLIASLCILVNQVVNLTISYDYTLEEYKIMNSDYYDKALDSEEKDPDFETMYKRDMLYKEQEKVSNIKSIIVCGANILIVGAFILVLNKKNINKGR